MRLRTLQYAAVALTVGLIVLLTGTASLAAIPAWSSWEPATVSDIFLDVSGLQYTLTLGSSPTLTYLGNTYPINWVSAFALVSDAETHYFTASGGPAGTWAFDTWLNDVDKIAVAGWAGTGAADRLPAGQSKVFVYNTLDITGNSVMPGIHIGYQDGGAQVTRSFKCPLPPENVIPEWSSLSLCTVALPPLTLFRRRLRK